MKTHIITVGWNNWRDSKELLDSIYSFTDPDTFELFFVNNGSVDETPKELFKYPKIHRYDSPVNTGFSGGFNRGFDMSENFNSSPDQFICIINNDMIVTPDWLKNLVEGYNELLSQGIQLGYTAPLNNYTCCPQQKASGVDDKPEWVAERGRFLEASLPYMCILFKRSLLNTVGYLDAEISPLGMAEDADYNWRAVRLGYRNFIDSKVWIYHKGSRSVLKVPNINEEFGKAVERMNKKHEKWEKEGIYK